MIHIKNLRTNEIYKIAKVDKADATKDSFIVDFPITEKFRLAWSGVFFAFYPIGSCTQIVLKDGFKVVL